MRIVVAIYESAFANHILERLIASRPGEVTAVLRSDAVLPGVSLPATVVRVGRRGGLPFALLKALETLVLRRRGAGRTLEAICRDAQVSLLPVGDINTRASRARLEALAPDLLVSLHFNQRIRRRCLDIPRLGALNVHGALLPRQRGLFPYFWALARGERELGSTVHWMDDDLDTGAILVQAPVPIRDDDTVLSLEWRTAELGAALLPEALAQIAAGTAPGKSQSGADATYHSWPRLRDVLALYRRGRRYGLWDAWRRPG